MLQIHIWQFNATTIQTTVQHQGDCIYSFDTPFIPNFETIFQNKDHNQYFTYCIPISPKFSFQSHVQVLLTVNFYSKSQNSCSSFVNHQAESINKYTVAHWKVFSASLLSRPISRNFVLFSQLPVFPIDSLIFPIIQCNYCIPNNSYNSLTFMDSPPYSRIT